MSRNYIFRNPQVLYFFSFAVVEWLDGLWCFSTWGDSVKLLPRDTLTPSNLRFRAGAYVDIKNVLRLTAHASPFTAPKAHPQTKKASPSKEKLLIGYPDAPDAPDAPDSYRDGTGRD